MAQLKGKKLICVEGGSPLFRNAVAQAAGLDLEQDVDIELLANPDLVRAGFAARRISSHPLPPATWCSSSRRAGSRWSTCAR